MKTQASKPRKALSILLAFLMVLSVGIMDWSALILNAEAASSKASDKICGDLSFWAPEVIYLYPNAASYSSSTSTQFQWFVNNYSNGTVKTTYDTAGYIYFSYATASNTTLSYRFMNSSFGTLSGGSISLSATSGLGTSSTVTINRNTSSYSPSLGSGENGCWIEWTLSFTDTKDNVAKKAYAYTYVYKPYMMCVGSGADGATGRINWNWSGAVLWISGIHGINSRATNISSKDSWDGTYEGTGGLDRFCGFISKENKGFAGSTTVTSGKQAYIENQSYTHNYSGSTDWYAVYAESSSGYSLKKGSNSNPGMYLTSSGGSLYNYVGAKHARSGKDTNACVYNLSTGNIYVDTSRYSNLKDIPNLALGFTVIDDERSGNNSATWYVGDISGSSPSETEYNKWHGDSSEYYDLIGQNGGYRIRAQDKGRWSNAYYENEDIRYAGAWPRTMSTSTSQQGTTQYYLAKGYFSSRERSGGNNYDSCSHTIVKLQANCYNKQNLRAAVERAIKKMPALGVNGISSGSPTSCYFDANTNYKWTAFQSAFKAAVIALGQLNNTNNMNTLATNLENALNALCTNYKINANGGTLTGVDANGYYVTIGTNQKVTVTPPSTITKSRTGYTFKGWSTDASCDPANAKASVEVGYNQTVYAIWQIHQSTLSINPNTGTWGGTTNVSNKTQNYNTTLSVPIPTKDGWTFTSWTKSSTFYGTLSSTTAAATYAYPADDGVTSTIVANWKRTITNTYHYIDAAGTDKTLTVSGTSQTANGSTPSTTISLTSPTVASSSNVLVTEYTKNDKTWTLKGWGAENAATVHGGATQTATVGIGTSHSVSTGASSHVFNPVYALKSTKFYANYNYLADGATTYSKIGKNTTVNGDATTGAMAVPVGSDNGSGAEVAKYYSKDGRIYELKGWSLTDGTLDDGRAVAIPYTTTATTATLNVPGAGTPTSTANLTPIELYPVYDLYATAIHAHFLYYTDNNDTPTYLDVSGQAFDNDGTGLGTVVFPGADQVQTSYIKGNVRYDLLGWTLSATDYNFKTFGASEGLAVLANPATDFYVYHPVYKATTTSRFYFYDASGVKTSITKDSSEFKTDSFVPTSTTVDMAQPADINTTITLDGRTFTFIGWRTDTVSGNMTIDKSVASEAHTIREAEYTYYAIYKNDTLTLSYNTTHDGITALDIPASQSATQYINAGTGNADINNATAYTFTVNPSNTPVAKTGYTFIGWGVTDSEIEDKDYVNGNPITVKVDTVLYARFNVNLQNVKFVYYDGSDLEGDYKELTKQVSYDDLLRDDTATNGRYVVIAPTVQKVLSDNVISSANIAHANDKYHYVFREWVRSDGKGVYSVVNSGVNYTAKFKNVTEDITIQALYNAYAHHYVDMTTAELNASGITADETAFKEATCTRNGYQYKKCTDCGHIYKAVLEAYNHCDAGGNSVKVYSGYVAPSCEKTGYYATAACAICGDTVKTDGKICYYDIVDDEYVEVESEDGIIPALDHDYQFSKTVAPTCTEKGYDLYVCSRNETHIDKRNYQPITGHTETTVPAVEPTCTKDGRTERIICSVCSCIIEDSFIVPATGHTLTKHSAVEASCEADGNIEYYSCSVCNKLYADKYATVETTAEAVVLEALGHNYVESEAEEATCTKAGHTAGTVCSRCGAVEPGSTAVETVPALGHLLDGGVHTASATPCDVPGYTTYTCTRNGCDYTEVVDDELEPHVEKEIPEIPATCTELGKSAHKVCEVCGKTLSNYKWLPLADHDYEEVTPEVPATCTTAGTSAVLKCANCTATTGGETIPALGHDYTPWVTNRAATCTENGVKERICKVCSYVETAAIIAPGHNVIEVEEVSATCTADGATAGEICSVCGAVISGCEIIPMTSHTMGEFVTVRETSCDVEGLKVSTCTKCDYSISEIIPTVPHTPEVTKSGKAPTCKEAGLTDEVTCSVCNHILEDQVKITKLEHEYTTVNEIPATCTGTGTSSYIECANCGWRLTEPKPVNANGHSWGAWQLVSAATCTEDGSRVRYCTVEGCEAATAVVDEDAQTTTLNKLTHNMTFVARKEATCTAAGNIAHYVCSRCPGKYFTDAEGTSQYTKVEIPAKGHFWTTESFPATCTEGSYDLETCTRCGNTNKIVTSDPAGHRGGSANCQHKATCTVCNKEYGGLGDHEYIPTVIDGTCIERGTVIMTCAVCGKSYETLGDYGDHKYSYDDMFVLVAPSCTSEGQYEITCELCGEIVVSDTLDMLEHTDGNDDGYCDLCGAVINGSAIDHSGKCDRCGMNHKNPNSSLFGYNGFFCKIIAAIRRLFGITK